MWTDETIVHIALQVNGADLLNLFLTCHRFSLFAQDEHFWKLKFAHDYNPITDYDTNWKYLYQHIHDVWVSDARGFTRIDDIKGKKAATGSDYILILDLKGDVWGRGNSHDGQLGFVVPRYVTEFKKVNLTAKDILCGYGQSYLINENELHVFGINEYYSMGCGALTNILYPQRLEFKVKQISTRGFHTLLIDHDDNLWVCGLADKGQLGLGHNRSLHFFAKHKMKVKSVAATDWSSAVIDMNDELWTFGANNSGELGLGDNIDRNVPHRVLGIGKVKAVYADAFSILALDMNNDLWGFGDGIAGPLTELPLPEWASRRTKNITVPTRISIPFTIQQIYCPEEGAFIIDTDNNLWRFCLINPSPILVKGFKAIEVASYNKDIVIIGAKY